MRKPWERALENLAAFMDTSTPQAAARPATKSRRLAWFLDPQTQHVEVAEQVARGKGEWTDGRPVAMKRLHERDPRLDYLTEHDRLALRFLRKETAGWYGEESYAFDVSRTIPALVRRPAVFDARHRSRPLERRSPASHPPLPCTASPPRPNGARWWPGWARATCWCAATACCTRPRRCSVSGSLMLVAGRGLEG